MTQPYRQQQTIEQGDGLKGVACAQLKVCNEDKAISGDQIV
jgi:hypothetical protein